MDVPGETNMSEYKIEVTVPDTIRVKPCPLPYSLEGVVREELSHTMQLGIIEIPRVVWLHKHGRDADGAG